MRGGEGNWFSRFPSLGFRGFGSGLPLLLLREAVSLVGPGPQIILLLLECASGEPLNSRSEELVFGGHTLWGKSGSLFLVEVEPRSRSDALTLLCGVQVIILSKLLHRIGCKHILVLPILIDVSSDRTRSSVLSLGTVLRLTPFHFRGKHATRLVFVHREDARASHLVSTWS